MRGRPFRSLVISALPRRRVVAAIASPVLLAVAAVVMVYWVERTNLKAWGRQTYVAMGPGESRFLYECDEPRTPPMRSVELANLGDEEEVIGVELGGISRAYRLRTMSDKNRHIVNDVIGDTPLTVTYCDLSGCIRAFRGERGGEPLPIRQAGILGHKMVLRIDKIGYLQHSGEIIERDPSVAPTAFPFKSAAYTHATWGDWKAAHPDTDVYVGDEPATAGNAEVSAASQAAVSRGRSPRPDVPTQARPPGSS